jgi:hypothetical protein
MTKKAAVKAMLVENVLLLLDIRFLPACRRERDLSLSHRRLAQGRSR